MGCVLREGQARQFHTHHVVGSELICQNYSSITPNVLLGPPARTKRHPVWQKQVMRRTLEQMLAALYRRHCGVVNNFTLQVSRKKTAGFMARRRCLRVDVRYASMALTALLLLAAHQAVRKPLTTSHLAASITTFLARPLPRLLARCAGITVTMGGGYT